MQSWGDTLRKLQQDDQNAMMAQNQQKYDAVMGIFNQDNAAAEEQSHNRDIVNSAVFMSGKNGLFSPNISEQVSSQLGQQVVGGVNLPDGGYAYLGPSRTEQGKLGIVGKVDALTRYGILQRAGLGDRTYSQRKALWGLLTKKYTPEQLNRAGMMDPETQGGTPVIGGYVRESTPMSNNVNLTTGVGTSSGARPGPRKQYISENDLNGTPYMQPNGEGTRYRGHGISTFSTTDFQEDREEKRRKEQQAYEVAIKTAESKARGRSGGRTAEEQMAIDNNRNANALARDNDKRDLVIRKLYDSRVIADESAIDAYSKSRKTKKIKGMDMPLSKEELAAAEKDIADYRKRREEARARDFEGYDGRGGAGGSAGVSTGASTGERAGVKGSEKQEAPSQGGGRTVGKGGKEVSKKEYEEKVESGQYEGHAVSDNTGTHYYIEGEKKVEKSKDAQGASQAKEGKEDNSSEESWGSLTPEQIKKAKAKGCTYDATTGEIVRPDGKRKKVK